MLSIIYIAKNQLNQKIMYEMSLNETLILIERKFQLKAPVFIRPMLDFLKINLKYVKYDDNNISGSIKYENNKYIIKINENHHYTRQRFTAAHELSHFLLHKNDINYEIIDNLLYRSGLSAKKEIQANKLAADLLMPYDLINKYSNKTLNELAEKFKVSNIAMAIRIECPT